MRSSVNNSWKNFGFGRLIQRSNFGLATKRALKAIRGRLHARLFAGF
jgi:hypothetical protein